MQIDPVKAISIAQNIFAVSAVILLAVFIYGRKKRWIK